MLKLTAATLAGFMAVLIIYGAPIPVAEPEVTRRADTDSVPAFSLAGLVSSAAAEGRSGMRDATFALSESQAIDAALEAGRSHAVAHVTARSLRGVVGAEMVQTASAEGFERTVTGSSVNLRSGPGTGNSVVGRVGLGDRVVALDDASGWVQIRTPGGVTGWIFGKYLDG